MLVYAGNQVDFERWDPKDPADIDAFQFDWNPLLDAGDSIVSHLVTVVDPGLSRDSDNEQSGFVTATLSGGVAGKDYRVECRVTISDGRTLEGTGVVPVRKR